MLSAKKSKISEKGPERHLSSNYPDFFGKILGNSL
jgi:hypothetical protein